MDLSKARIGLSLSGGGIRAAIFHLGVLKYLAEAKLFGQITSLSSVSGASLCIGVIIAANGNKWPTGDEFLQSVLPKVREIILQHNIQDSALKRLPFSPYLWWNSKVELVAQMLEKKWGIKGSLQDMPRKPFWEINCTTYETGKSFRIRWDFMGDHRIGYTQNPNLPISHMMAASAGFPVLIGPYTLKTEGMRWTRDKWGEKEEVNVGPKYTLWDGGVYDNLGLEALYKIGRGLDAEIDFLIVSNAAASISYKERKRSVSASNMIRLLDIAMSQVDSLRSREILASVVREGKGMYLKIGNSAAKIAEAFNIPTSEAERAVGSSLTPQDVELVRKYPTTLKSPTPEDFERILQHGYENVKYVHFFSERKRLVMYI